MNMHIQCVHVYNNMLLFIYLIYIINMAKAAYNYTKSITFHVNYTSPVSITYALYGSPHRKAHVCKNGTHQRMAKKAHLRMV